MTSLAWVDGVSPPFASVTTPMATSFLHSHFGQVFVLRIGVQYAGLANRSPGAPVRLAERECRDLREVVDQRRARMRRDIRALVVRGAWRGHEANACAEREWHREVELEDVTHDDELLERRAGLG